MSILRSTLERAAFISVLTLLCVGCSENANSPSNSGEPSEAGRGTSSTKAAAPDTSSTSQSSSDALGGSTGSPNANRSSNGGTNAKGAEPATVPSNGGSPDSDKATSNRSEVGSSAGGTSAGGTGAGRSSVGNDGRSGAATKASGGANGGASNKTAAVGSGGSKASSSQAVGGASANGSNKGLTLYYIRHAEVVANTVDPDQITLENADTLTDLGLSQVDALTKYLQSEIGATPDAVLVSPTKRTQKTIEPYLVAKELQGEIWMELTECCTQAPTGAALPTQPKYMSFYKAEIVGKNLTLKDPSANLYWQNDTYEQGLFMVMTAKADILSRYGQSGKTIFVVGHASAGQIMIGLLRGDDMTQGATTTGANAVYLLNTGVMKLTQDPATGLFKVVGRNMNKPATSS